MGEREQGRGKEWRAWKRRGSGRWGILLMEEQREGEGEVEGEEGKGGPPPPLNREN